MKKLIIFLICTFAINFLLYAEEGDTTQIDLNQATLAEIKSLPITEEQAQDIYYYRTYIKYFESVYELRDIESIDQETFNRIKPLVKIVPYQDYDEVAHRRDEIYYLIRDLTYDEGGSQESITDLWEDILISPININTATYREVLNLPIISPSDVKAVFEQRRVSSFTDWQSLRNTPGATYYGLSRIRHYVSYKEPEDERRMFFNYRYKLNTGPFSEDEEYNEILRESFVPDSTDEKFSTWGFYNLDNAPPEVSHKFRVRLEDWIDVDAGVLLFANKGETRNFNFMQFDEEMATTLNENSKKTLSFNLKPINTKIILGNYRASYGQGLVMENTDDFSFRRTGYQYSKRIQGVFPDLSTTEEFQLNGMAVEYNNDFLNASLFYSDDKKDAVLWDSNNNGVIDDEDDIFYYIVSRPRFTNQQLESAEEYFNEYRPFLEHPLPEINMAPRRDTLREILRGGHIEFYPVLGTSFGITAYETVYNKHFTINPNNSVGEFLIADSYYYDKIRTTDSEIASLYSTRTGEYDRNYRRVYGFDWLTTHDRFTLQGEYAELEVDGSPLKLGDDPKAIVASGLINFDNFSLFMLYRNYDLDFDNPYARPFAEHERFDGTILEKQYYLKNPLVSQVYYNSPWAQPEEGIYIETNYYRLHRKLTLTKAYLDIWERKSDSRRSVRFQGELDYRPIYDVSIRLKQKWQTNRYDDYAARAVSKTSETTPRIIFYLTNRDRIELEYRYNKVWMAPYTSLTNSAEPGDTLVPTADVLNHGEYIAANYTHNFNDYFQIQGSILFWNGHGISHWDWEDMEIDFMGSEGMKYWFTLYDRISPNLAISFKYRVKKYKDEELYLRQYNEPIEGENYIPQTKHKERSIRLQIDWNFNI
jgi:DNA uptake protein ComE-like DNA-binding protein